MENYELDNYLLNQKLTAGAWKSISSDFPLTHQMLKRWSMKLDWKRVSRNNSILWTIEMLDEFQNNIDWKELTSYGTEKLFHPSIIERFKDLWDWNELLDNHNFKPSEAIIEKYADRWNWYKLLRVYQIDDLYGTTFFHKFQQYIKPRDLDGSYLYTKLLEERVSEIVSSLLGVEEK